MLSITGGAASFSGSLPRFEVPGGERGRPHDAAAARGASAGLTDQDFDALFIKERPRPLSSRLRQHRPAACSSNGCTTYAKQALRDRLIAHEAISRQRGEDMPEVREWR
jgi:hypothetical protein